MSIGTVTAEAVAQTIAARCVALREQLGLSLQEVADRAKGIAVVGVSP